MGDLIYVTGALGGAAAGLEELTRLARRSPKHGHGLPIPKSLAPSLECHFYPRPRLLQGLWLQKRRAATAAIDLSDGLSTDLAHVCEESGLAAEINASDLPLAPGATLAQALHGGEDYELLFTAPATVHIPKKIAGVPVTHIGRMIRRRAGQPMIGLRSGEAVQPLAPQGWRHFA